MITQHQAKQLQKRVRRHKAIVRQRNQRRQAQRKGG